MLAWLAEQATQEKLQHCADFAISVLHNDLTLRVPRSADQRTGGFADWRNVWHNRLGTAIQDEFHRQFPGITSRLSPGIINATEVDYIWPQIYSELLSFAIEGLTRAWVRRRMGDAVILKRPRSEGANWVVPIGIQGRDADIGQVVLDRDGNIIEENSSSRADILAHIHG